MGSPWRKPFTIPVRGGGAVGCFFKIAVVAVVVEASAGFTRQVSHVDSVLKFKHPQMEHVILADLDDAVVDGEEEDVVANGGGRCWTLLLLLLL